MNELPRVLLCSFEVLPGPTGTSRRLTEYLRGLAGHFNVVVLSTKTPDHPHIEKLHGARLLRVPVGTGDLPSRLQTFDRAVRRQLESEEYALAHFTDPFGGYALCELRQRYDFKLVYEAQSFPSQELRYTAPQLEGDRKFLAKIRRQELFCLMNAERVLTGSNVTASLIATLGVPSEQVEVVRAPVDLEAYRSAAVEEGDARPVRVVYLGSQVAWQGLPTLVRAVHLASRSCDLHVSIVGPSHPARRPLLDDLVSELGLTNRITFEPPLPHSAVHALLRSADVCVVPLDDHERNRIQGGPLSKVAEYLAAGRPVIAADLPICREVLSDACALFHEPGDADDLARCLTELGSSSARRARMGRAAQALAAEQHDTTRITARLRQLYGELTGAGIRRPRRTELHSDARDQTDPAIRLDPDRPSLPFTPPIEPTLVSPPAAPPERSAADERRERRRRREEDEDEATDHAAVAYVLPTDAPPFAEDEVVEIDTVVALAPPIADSDAPRVAPPLAAPAPVTAPIPTPLPARTAAGQSPVGAPPPLPPPLPRSLTTPRPVHIPEPEGPLEVDAESLVEPAEELEEASSVEALPLDVDSADDAVLESHEDPPTLLEPLTELAPVHVPPSEPEVIAAAEPPVELEVVSRMDAWFAQLVHGYCPPEGAQFARHTPPTNFPGREGPPPPTVQPPAAGPQSFPSRSGEG